MRDITERREHYLPTLIIEQPSGVLNRQLAYGRDCSTIEEIYGHLIELGYDVAHSLEDALQYGIPQHRERVLICASQTAPVPFIVGQDRAVACDGGCVGTGCPCFKHAFATGHESGRLTLFNTGHSTTVQWYRGYAPTITCSANCALVPAVLASKSLPGVMVLSHEGGEVLQGLPWLRQLPYSVKSATAILG